MEELAYDESLETSLFKESTKLPEQVCKQSYRAALSPPACLVVASKGTLVSSPRQLFSLPQCSCQGTQYYLTGALCSLGTPLVTPNLPSKQQMATCSPQH